MFAPCSNVRTFASVAALAGLLDISSEISQDAIDLDTTLNTVCCSPRHRTPIPLVNRASIPLVNRASIPPLHLASMSTVYEILDISSEISQEAIYMDSDCSCIPPPIDSSFFNEKINEILDISSEISQENIDFDSNSCTPRISSRPQEAPDLKKRQKHHISIYPMTEKEIVLEHTVDYVRSPTLLRPSFHIVYCPKPDYDMRPIPIDQGFHTSY